MDSYTTYIHIGFPKTATTFLQESFYPKVEKCCYLGKGGNCDFEYRNTIASLESKGIFGLTEHDIDKCKEFIKDQNTINYDKVVISDELFSGGENVAALANNCYAFKKAFDKPKIIFTFRRQDNFLESFYREGIRMGNFSSVDYFLNRKKDGSFDKHYPCANTNHDVQVFSWYKIYKYLQSQFGEENVLALPFEQLVKNKKDFFDTLCAFMGTTPYYPDTQKKERKSHSYRALTIIRFLNRFINNQKNGFPVLIQNPLYPFLPATTKNENFIIRNLRNFSNKLTLYSLGSLISRLPFKEKKFLDQKTREAILKLHREGNAKLAQEIGIDLSQYGYF